MHSKAYYDNILFWPWVGFSVLINILSIAWVSYIFHAKPENGKTARKAMEAITRLAFPTIFSAYAVADRIESHNDGDNNITVEITSHKKQSYFEDRKPVTYTFRLKLHWRLFIVTGALIALIFQVFLRILLLEVSFDCDFSNECFLIDSPKDSLPLNCSEDINEDLEIICYRLHLNFGVAFAISYGVFKMASLFCHIVAVITLAFVGSSRCCAENKRLKAWLARVILVLVIYSPMCVLLIYYSYIDRKVLYNPDYMWFQVGYSCMTTTFFMISMPWKDMVEKTNMEKLSDDEPNTHARL